MSMNTDKHQILHGFLDSLKRARNIKAHTIVTLPHLSFHTLTLILERGRAMAKRVLVGSAPFIRAHGEAKTCGYEVHILNRVRKVRESRKAKWAGGYGTSGQSSGSEGHVSTSETGKFEQGVDELLHLKMMESLIDSDIPSTMVLATGDGAEAEYSDGFLRMVERALKKGWSVELVSWENNTSKLYQARSFRGKWGKRFNIFWLDKYSEELLDMGSY
jgi:hypothetical protein